jgi:hypothetical protein
VSEKKVLRKIFAPKVEDVTKERKNLHNVNFLNLYVPRNIVWLHNKEEWSKCDIWHMMAYVGEARNAYRISIRILK